MSKTRPHRLAALVVVLLTLACAGWARADGSGAGRAKSKAHFMRGARLYKEGNYDQAIIEYQAAYDALPIPEFLFNLGQAYRLKGEGEKALELYNRYLTLAPEGPVAGEVRTNVAELTKQLEAERAAEHAKAEQEAEAKRRAQSVTLTVAPVDSAPPTPMYKKWWLWTAAGGVVVIALGVGLGVGLSHGPSAPGATTTDGTLHPF